MGLKRRGTVDHGTVDRRTEDHHRNGVLIGVW
jgi:hypothetical protein